MFLESFEKTANISSLFRKSVKRANTNLRGARNFPEKTKTIMSGKSPFKPSVKDPVSVVKEAIKPSSVSPETRARVAELHKKKLG